MRTMPLALCAVLLANCSRASGPSQLLPVDQATGATSLSSSGFESLYSFTGKPDGAEPAAALVTIEGTFYGTTQSGGENDHGSVFSLSASGSETVLYSFGSSSQDGTNPAGSLIDVDGTLYGTTQYGGANCAPAGCGTVFKISTSGAETVLYSFSGGTDGAHPVAGLIDAGGTLYGTTAQGGNGGACCGTVFAITASGQERVLYRFKGTVRDGAEPIAGLIDAHGEFYGTTRYGGAKRRGTIFALSPSGNERVLYSFKGLPSDGAEPFAALVAASGKLYGTTRYGGRSTKCRPLGCGIVFETTTSGTEKVLYAFKGRTDGFSPLAGVVAVNGALYGTTYSGGNLGCAGGVGCGTLFKVSSAGVESVLYTFRGGKSSTGAFPPASLIVMNGALYGTTFGGGVKHDGTAFKILP